MTDYELGIPDIDDALGGGIRGGTNILVLGPPMSGKDTIINNIIYHGLASKEAAIIVSTEESGEDMLEWFSNSGMSVDAYMNLFGIVDCVSATLGLDVKDTASIRRVSGPMNLTKISVNITNYFNEFWMKRGVRKARLCVNSLSTMLMYTNLQAIFRFLHVHTRRIKTANSIGFYIVEDGVHDAQTMETFKQLFDGIIKVEVEEGHQFMQIIGLTPQPTKWYEFAIDDDNKLNIKRRSDI